MGAQALFGNQHTSAGKQSHFEQIAPFESGCNQLAAIVCRRLLVLFFLSIPFGDIRHRKTPPIESALRPGPRAVLLRCYVG
jgi:hypothetical protein